MKNIKRLGLLLLILITALIFAACTGADGLQGPPGQNGANGANGQDGAQGLPGQDGKDGKDGAPGQNGANGQDGVDGKDGATWHNGAANPANSVGVNGDFYINTVTFEVFLKGGGSWYSIGGIKGEDGKDGLPGQNGQDGAPGQDGKDGIDVAKWLSGAANPVAATGVAGDWYLNTTTFEIFEKTAAAGWTSRGIIKGEQGEPGEHGGPPGKSAFELYKERNPGYAGDETQWLDDLINGRLVKGATWDDPIVMPADVNGGFSHDGMVSGGRKTYFEITFTESGTYNPFAGFYGMGEYSSSLEGRLFDSSRVLIEEFSVECRDYSWDDYNDDYSFYVPSAGTYTVVLWNRYYGTFEYFFEILPPYAGGTADTAIPLTSNPAMIPIAPRHNSYWFSFTVPATGTYKISLTSGLSYNVFEGFAFEDIGYGDGETELPLFAGKAYYLWVRTDNWSGTLSVLLAYSAPFSTPALTVNSSNPNSFVKLIDDIADYIAAAYYEGTTDFSGIIPNSFSHFDGFFALNNYYSMGYILDNMGASVQSEWAAFLSGKNTLAVRVRHDNYSYGHHGVRIAFLVNVT